MYTQLQRDGEKHKLMVTQTGKLYIAAVKPKQECMSHACMSSAGNLLEVATQLLEVDKTITTTVASHFIESLVHDYCHRENYISMLR